MFRLIHLSDPHLGPIPIPRMADLFGKRFAGYMNWMIRRRNSHDMDLLARIVSDIRDQNPDHIACVGDLINISLPAEFPPAAQFLARLGTPARVSLVPGNHDAYVASVQPEIERFWGPWMTTDSGRFEGFPYIRMLGPLALIGLSSGVSTWPFLATGRLGIAQRDKLTAALKFLKIQGLARVILIHHPPYQGGATVGRTLTDAAEFEAIMAECGAELILHGHNHRTSIAHLAGPDGLIPVIGVPSASAARGTPGHRAGYHIFDFDMTEKGVLITGKTRGLLENGDIGPVGHLGLTA
jgi:3',5'-cyclic AMP phosphodiesterase CpdA